MDGIDIFFVFDAIDLKAGLASVLFFFLIASALKPPIRSRSFLENMRLIGPLNLMLMGSIFFFLGGYFFRSGTWKAILTDTGLYFWIFQITVVYCTVVLYIRSSNKMGELTW